MTILLVLIRTKLDEDGRYMQRSRELLLIEVSSQLMCYEGNAIIYSIYKLRSGMLEAVLMKLLY